MRKKQNKHSKPVKNIQEKIFTGLCCLVLILMLITIAKAKGLLIPKQPELKIENGIVDLDSMTLEQKIAQMTVALGIPNNLIPLKNMQLGGVHIFALESESVFRNIILDFQSEMKIPFFITADLEGCVNPFAYYKNFTAAHDVLKLGDSFEKGFVEGKYLKELGFTLNFAPVVDLNDEIWKCRTFPGDEENIAEFAEAYSLGLQAQGILATIKHYPGKTLVVKDPHKFIVVAEINGKDIYPYDYFIQKENIDAIMVSHIITSGVVNSEGVPAVVSPRVIEQLKQKFNGLVISDEIHMLGLKNFYSSLDEMYIAVFKAGNDVILNFDNDPNELYHMIQVIKAAVERGDIPEEQIDNSVSKILVAKGFTIK